MKLTLKRDFKNKTKKGGVPPWAPWRCGMAGAIEVMADSTI